MFDRSRILAVACVSTLSVFFVSAQTIPGRISGTVTDSSGASVAGAHITITNDATALKWKALTDNGGFYLVTNLPVGTYNVDVEASGFRKAEKQGYDLVDDGRITADFALQLGSVQIAVALLKSLTGFGNAEISVT